MHSLLFFRIPARLVQRRHKTLSMIFRDVVFFLSLSLLPLRATGDTQIPINNFQIQQETTCQNGIWVSKPRSLDEQIAFLLQVNRIKSLEEYSQWLKNNLSYQDDRAATFWQDPQKTLAQGYGDCKNFAFLTEAVLRVAGFSPLIMACFTQEGGHAFCVFQVDGYFYWFNNAILEKTTARSLQTFEQDLIRKYHLLSLLKLNTANQRWEILYRRS